MSVLSNRRVELLVTCVSLVVLLAWAMAFKYTGEGDAIMHHLNARDALADPKNLLYAWARPLFKVWLVPAYPFGHFATRAVVCAMSALCVYHTIRLAADLKLSRPAFAGAMVLLQPFAFAVASDTMSEMPMALGTLLAVRLWVNDKRRWSCLVVGLLPMVRPEGFFFGAIWGVLVLSEFTRLRTDWLRTLARLGCLSVGLILWSAMCAAFSDGQWDLWIRAWSWPAVSYEYYPRGDLLYYVWSWPAYVGVVLLVPFLIGLIRLRWQWRALWLPVTCWAIVLAVHSVLFWGHWFASAGLLRINACTSPFTALICLAGYNVIADRLQPRGRRWLAIGGLLAGSIAVLHTYFLDRAHWYTFPVADVSAWMRGEGLLAPGAAPHYFFGNQIFASEFGFTAGATNLMPNPTDPDRIRQFLREMPIGSVGVWDDQQAQQWHGATLAELEANGFTPLYESNIVGRPFAALFMWNQQNPEVRFVVYRKTGQFGTR
jgi:hypothetical protein